MKNNYWFYIRTLLFLIIGIKGVMNHKQFNDYWKLIEGLFFLGIVIFDWVYHFKKRKNN